EIAAIPFPEDVAHLVRRHAENVFHQGVRLANHLHVAVFDPVVDHFYIMAGAIGSDVSSAGHAAFNRFARRGAFERLAGFRIDLGGDRLPDRFDFLPGLKFAARHQRGTESRALLASGDAGTDKPDSLLLQFALAPNRIGPLRVAAIDDDVAFVEKRNETFNNGVGRSSGLDENDDPPRRSEG